MRAIIRRGATTVEVRRAVNPAGRAAVLIQLEDGFVLLLPTDAKHLAEAITLVASDIEADQ